MKTYLALGNSVLDLVDFDITEALDLREIATCSCMYRGNCVISIGLELRDIYRANSMSLDCVDVDN